MPCVGESERKREERKREERKREERKTPQRVVGWGGAAVAGPLQAGQVKGRREGGNVGRNSLSVPHAQCPVPSAQSRTSIRMRAAQSRATFSESASSLYALRPRATLISSRAPMALTSTISARLITPLRAPCTRSGRGKMIKR